MTRILTPMDTLHRRWLEVHRKRDDAGNLIAVLILVTVLALLAALTLAAVIPSFGTAQTSQLGEMAVAQAKSGLHDVMYRLDQAGDNVADFCVGDPPASVLPSDLSDSSCLNENATSPVGNAPGVRYEVVSRVTNQSLPQNVTDELQVTVHAQEPYPAVAGQTPQYRTVTAYIYRVAASFGLYAVSSMNFNGALKQAQIYVTSGAYPVTSADLVAANLVIGVGPDGSINCEGNNGTAPVIEVGQNGATNTGCNNYQQSDTGLVPNRPAFCTGSQVSTAFSPCVNISGSNYESYCPLPGDGFANQPTSTITTAPPSNAVFNCTSTNGAAVAIGDASSATACANSTAAPSIPGGFTDLPEGSYYINSNAVTMCDLPASVVQGGAVSLFMLPQDCTNGVCPWDTPSVNGTSCAAPSNAASASLTLDGQYIDAAATPEVNSNIPYAPGNPSQFLVYWGGDQRPVVNSSNSAPLVFSGYMYAPAAQYIQNGNSNTAYWYGSLSFNCFNVNGSPNFVFVYPQHPSQFIQGWQVTHYSITP